MTIDELLRKLICRLCLAVAVASLFIATFFGSLAAAPEEGLHREKQEKSESPKRLFFGECYSVDDPKQISAGSFPSACLRGSIFSESLIGTDSAYENLWLAGGRGYLGIHASTWLSVHGSGHFTRAENTRFGSEFARESDVDFLTANLGNPSMHRWRLIGGRPSIPFGIGDSPIMEVFQLLGIKRYWGGLETGVVGIYDNLADFQLEVSALSSSPREQDKHQRRIGNDAAAVRMSYDIPALDGSRIILSGYGDRRAERRVGFAFLNVSVKGDVTHFEFVRTYQFHNEKLRDPEQLLRLAYLGAYRSGSRWAVQYDDVRRLYRLGVLGQDFALRESLVGRLGIGYRKSASEVIASRWFLAGGLLWSL